MKLKIALLYLLAIGLAGCTKDNICYDCTQITTIYPKSDPSDVRTKTKTFEECFQEGNIENFLKSMNGTNEYTDRDTVWVRTIKTDCPVK